MTSKIIPQKDIDKLEQVRKDIFQLAESLKIDVSLLVAITAPMWRLTHTKYKEYVKGGFW